MSKMMLEMAAKTIARGIFVVVGSAPSSAEYVKAKPGNGAAQAEAYCNMVARGSRRGFLAIGSPDFVGGAALGNGIGNMIRQARTKQDCITMMGYDWVRPKAAATKNGAGHDKRNPKKSY